MKKVILIGLVLGMMPETKGATVELSGEM